MITEDVFKLSNMDRLLYYISEREAIRLKKTHNKPKPWTDDEILQTYRFTNVRRMDDKVSVWLLDNWYTRYFNHLNMVVACTLARFINNPSTLEVIGFPTAWNSDKIRQDLRSYRDIGNHIFNAAYMVRGNDGIDKISAVVDHYCQPLVDDPVSVDPDSMFRTWSKIKRRYGFGSFMAGQVVADLRHAVKGNWKDKDTWAPVGPGSMRGLNRLLNRPIKYVVSQEQFLTELTEIIKDCRMKVGNSITDRMEAHDYQNCLCEYDKYERVLNLEGRPKQLYPGKR